MRVLITGATGLLGGHLLEQGLRAGRDMLATSRGVHPRSFLARHPEIPHRAVDLTTAEGLSADLMRSVDTVIHCAGLASSQAKEATQMRDLHVSATSSLLDAALHSGVQCWVQVSSVATLSDGSEDVTVDEHRIGKMRDTLYARTKYEQERLVADRAASLRVVFAHPCYMLGRWDARPSSGAILHALKLGRMTRYVNRVKNFVAASDVAAGLWQAVDARAQGHYIFGHENRPIADFIQLADAALRLRGRVRPITVEELEQPGAVSDVERAWILEFCGSSSASSDKARSELGYRPSVSLEAAFEETVRYFAESKLL